MVFNIVVGGIIFTYSAWVLVSYVRRSRQGKCAACAMKKTCAARCEDPGSTGGMR